MEIHLISSLTLEDEARLAGAFLQAVAGLLNLLPIAYSIRIETASGQSFDRTSSPCPTAGETVAPHSSENVSRALHASGR